MSLTRMTLPALALAAAVALAAPPRAPVAAAAPAPTFEHKVLHLDYDEYKDTDVYKRLERDLKSSYLATLQMQEIALDRLGAEGWELVAVEQSTPAKPTFYLKRASAPK
jgi:hypothetical protein